MIVYTSLEEQVDADFARARRKNALRRATARLRNGPTPEGLHSFEEFRKQLGVVGRVRLGRRLVRSTHIVGSFGRCSEFDKAYLPAKASDEAKWKKIDLAFRRGEKLPPVSLYEVGDAYFVLDGNHRVSVARYHGVEMIDAVVTKLRIPSLAETNARRNHRAAGGAYAPRRTIRERRLRNARGCGRPAQDRSALGVA